MSDLALDQPGLLSGEEERLRQAVLAALGSLAPSLHVLAENMLAERTPIDLVGVEAGGGAAC